MKSIYLINMTLIPCFRRGNTNGQEPRRRHIAWRKFSQEMSVVSIMSELLLQLLVLITTISCPDYFDSLGIGLSASILAPLPSLPLLMASHLPGHPGHSSTRLFMPSTLTLSCVSALTSYYPPLSFF